MYPTKKMGLVFLAVFGMTVCTPDDDDRCDKGYVWDGENCIEKSTATNETPGTGTAQDTGTQMQDTNAQGTNGHDTSTQDTGTQMQDTNDGGVSTSADLPGGMGTSCTMTGGECAGLAASYCSASPQSPDGYCTLDMCNDAAVTCPVGYTCCDMTAIADPPVAFCATDADFSLMSGFNLCAAK